MPRKLSIDHTQDTRSHSGTNVCNVDAVDLETQSGETTVDPLSDKFEIKKGKVLIISNNFYDTSYERHGNEKDKEAMQDLFNNLGYYIEVLEDCRGENGALTKQSVESKLDDWSNNKNGILDDADGLIIVIMSHGKWLERENEECIELNSLEVIKPKEIYKKFAGNRCKQLLGKPKIFFIQACRGPNKERGTYATIVKAFPDSKPKMEYVIGNMAEFFIAHAAFPEYEGYLTEGGSWFIEALCTVLKTGIPMKKELHQMMIEVNRKVSRKHEVLHYLENDDENDTSVTPQVFKEVSNFFSSLTKEVYFSIIEN